MKATLFTALFLFSISSWASLVSSNLSESDRLEVLRTLGNASSLKVLGDPFPLGGYSGFEIGLAIESIPTDSFTDLGDKTADGDMLTYPVVSIGKGLYENIDLFVHFSAYGAENRVGVYGGLLRWGFFESKRLPLTLSLTIQSLSNNFDNQITGELSSAVLNLGLNFEDSSLYLGVGKLSSRAEFSRDLTDTPNKEINSAGETQIKVGGVWNFSPYFLSLEFNRYYISHITAKFGLRF